MDSSILNTVKKILGIDPNDTAFDMDIVTHTNSALAVLDQIGVGPSGGLFIEDDEAVWEDLELPSNQVALVKTFIFLHVRLLFDPPTTSFHLEAAKQQLAEHTVRLNIARELVVYPTLAGVTDDGS